MKIFLKNYTKYIFLFLFFLSVLVIFGYHNNQFDPMWNYGYSYAISKGEIPYKDFTLLTTPLFPLLFSIGLKLFSSDNIIFLIEQALLITVTFYFLFKLYNKKAWCVLFFMIFPFLNNIVPTYNFLVYFFIVVLIYLEKNCKNDYLIGFILGLIILTKQTIGVFMIIPSIIFFIKDRKKLFKRFFGMLIPCIIFFIYLLITDSLIPFVDICFFGLFDFAEKNTTIFTAYFCISIIFLFILFRIIKRDKKDITNYYILFSFSFLIPIFTEYHFYLFLMCFVLALLPYIKINDLYLEYLSIVFSVAICLFNFIFVYDGFNTTFLKNVNNFKYYLISKDSVNSFYKTLDLYDKYKIEDKSPIFLGTQAVYFTIINDEKIDYFDVLNRGNYGYNGSRKMIEKVSKMKNQIFIINMHKYRFAGKEDQLDKEVIKYVINNSELIDSWDCYYVYLKE